MTTKRAFGPVGAFVVAIAMLLTIYAPPQGSLSAAGAEQAQAGAPAGGRGGAARGAGGAAPAPVVAPGTLIAGAWGADPVPLDSRGWGWMTQSYVSAGYKRPFWNKAKELLFSGKQVVSYTI